MGKREDSDGCMTITINSDDIHKAHLKLLDKAKETEGLLSAMYCIASTAMGEVILAAYEREKKPLDTTPL